MLARLKGVSGLDDAGIDRSGTYLRLRAAHPDLARVANAAIDLLRTEGVVVERSGENVAEVERWYGPEDVRELSRAEAEELGREIAAAVWPALEPAAGEHLRKAIARHLHDAFVTHGLERGERVPIEDAVERVRAEASGWLSAEQLRAMLRALRTRLELAPPS